MAQEKELLIGVDFGLKRIGLSHSDPLGIFASPWCTVEVKKGTKKTALEILEKAKLLAKEKARPLGTIVVGLPLMLSGEDSFLTQETRKFIDEFKLLYQGEIVAFDERFTSKIAERSLEGMDRKERKKHIDAVSAALILQSYMEC